jgi:acyl-CoA synthetase (AMP-forming)/AMP-acid ligase II
MSVTSYPSPVVGVSEDDVYAALPGFLVRWAIEMGDEIAVTHLDYSRNPGGSAESITWSELERRVNVLAEQLQRLTVPGDRVAILIDQGIDYVVAFFAVLRAGLVAVPLFPPETQRHTEQVRAALLDSTPSVVLTTRSRYSTIRDRLSDLSLRGMELLAVERPRAGVTGSPAPVELLATDIAYLQYTSGSTRKPFGVMVTHENLVANARQAISTSAGTGGHSVVVSWLPLFHGMGLVLGAVTPVFAGIRSVLMDPSAFLERPARWLQALSIFPGAISGAPNFAYAYCVARIEEREKSLFRLDTVRSLIDGGEPVRPEIVADFCATFAECGLRTQVYRPSYGLAEATALVTATTKTQQPTGTAFSRGRLADGRAVPLAEEEPAEAGTVTLVSSGRPADQFVRIVDPETRQELPDGVVGEIWVSGTNVARGYWNRQPESSDTFCALISNVPADGEQRWWLRTGDLGTQIGGELYVTGRLNDLITVDGRNHYPEDVESTVERSHIGVRGHSVTAFSVKWTNGTRVAVMLERARHLPDGLSSAEIADAVRCALTAEHGFPVTHIVVLEPGGLPRTTSGKVSRWRCRRDYLTTHAFSADRETTG